MQCGVKGFHFGWTEVLMQLKTRIDHSSLMVDSLAEHLNRVDLLWMFLQIVRS
jgi:hypothetical protein